MMPKLNVLLVDQNPEGAAAIRRTLSFEDVHVVHETPYGPIALTWARSLNPAVILVAADEPLARPLSTIQALAKGAPDWTIVAVVPRYSPELFRKLVLAGARDVLVRTASADEMREAIFAARRMDVGQRAPGSYDPSAPTGTIVSVCGIKGGIGKTTIGVSLAISLARETSRSVALVDLDVPFGDVAVMLDLTPERDVLGALDDGVIDDPERLQAQLVPGPEGIHVLAAPLVPRGRVKIDPGRVTRLVTHLASLYDYVVVDTAPGLDEVAAAVLDASSLTLLLATPEVPCLRRTQAYVQLLRDSSYSTDRVKVVLNRAGSKTGLTDAEAEAVLGAPLAWRVTNDHGAIRGVALGQPLIISHPHARLSRDVRRIARAIAGLAPEARRRGLLSWLPMPGIALNPLRGSNYVAS